MLILKHEDFSPHVGSVFHVATEGFEPHDLELIDMRIQSTGSYPSYIKMVRVPFTLIFRGPASPLLPEAIHLLQHPVMGDQEIHVIPLGPLGQTDALFYQAIFN